MSSIDIPKRLPVLLVDRGIVFPSTHVDLPVVDQHKYVLYRTFILTVTLVWPQLPNA